MLSPAYIMDTMSQVCHVDVWFFCVDITLDQILPLFALNINWIFLYTGNYY